MNKPPNSAAYFSKNEKVMEFLNEFIKIRRLHNKINPSINKNEKLPYRRLHNLKDSDIKNINADILINVATQMSIDDYVHLDAFLSLVCRCSITKKFSVQMSIYDGMVNKLPSDIEYVKFNSSEVLNKSTITCMFTFNECTLY